MPKPKKFKYARVIARECQLCDKPIFKYRRHGRYIVLCKSCKKFLELLEKTPTTPAS